MSLQETKAAAATLLPHQMGVACPKATEHIPMMRQELIRSLAESPENDDWVLTQVDLTNAFNCVSRQHMLLAASESIPHLMPWLNCLYGQHLPLNVKGTEDTHIMSERGPQHGCNFVSFLFSLAIQPVIKALSNLWVNLWYADDGTIVGPTGAVETALHLLRQKMQPLGLELNLKKCVSWGPGLWHAGREDLLLRSTKCLHPEPGSGVIVLGTPVAWPDPSHQFFKSFWRGKLTELRTLLRKLSSLGHAQYEHALLKSSLDAARVTHLLRSMNTQDLDAELQEIRAMLTEAAECLVGKPILKEQMEQVFLPTRLAGLGLKDPCAIRASARLAAIASYATDFLPHSASVPEHLRAQLPADTKQVIAELRSKLGTHATPLEQWAGDNNLIHSASVREKAQQHWQDKVYVLAHRQLMEQASQRDKCRFALQTANTAQWLTCTPKPTDGTELDHCNFKLGLQW